HIPSGDFSGSGYKIFEYPPLNAEAYDPDAEPIVKETEPAVQQEDAVAVPSIQQDNPEAENQTQAQQLLQIVDGMIESGQKADRVGKEGRAGGWRWEEREKRTKERVGGSI